MSSFTPGPWSVQADKRHVMVIADKGGMAVIVSGADLAKPTPTDHANARLMASAPDLLERLKARRAECVCDGNPPGIAVCSACHADAAVIAKAEGK